MNDSFRNSRFASAEVCSALVIGHPGHELLLHGWLEVTHPLVFVFTDGSGRSKESRLASTTKILNQTGAKCGSIYGRLTDAASYAAILNHEFDVFVRLARELSEAFVTERIDCVVGDAFEGYNPMHDVCRLVINAAVTIAQRATGHHIANLQFSPVQPGACHDASHPNRFCRLLDEAALARKLAAAKGYAELAGEVLAALERTSTDAFRVECLRSVDPAEAYYACDEPPPFYEAYGEKQVAAGYYQQVLRYDEHMAPLAVALRRYVESSI